MPSPFFGRVRTLFKNVRHELLGYNETEERQILRAQKKAAVNLVRSAVRRKMKKLGFYAPLETYNGPRGPALFIMAGNLSKSFWRTEVDAQIRLIDMDLMPSPRQPALARFTVRCPTNALYETTPLAFMSFFKALGIDRFEEHVNNDRLAKLVETKDLSWLGTNDGLWFLKAVEGAIDTVPYGSVFCPLQTFLSALDLEETLFKERINAATSRQMKAFGPLRQKKAQRFLMKLEA